MTAILVSLPLTEPWFFWISLGALTAGFVRGLTGFGSAMVLFPILTLAVGPVAAAPVVQMLESVVTLPLLRSAFKSCHWREVFPLAMGAVAFVPLGVWLLINVDADFLRRVTAIVILVVVSVMACGWRYQGVVRREVSFGVGALSGVMGGATTLSGPPVALFWLGGQSDAVTVRANVIVFFGLSELVTLLSYALSGLYTRPVLVITILLAPIYGLGLLLGVFGLRFTTERIFRFLALALIAVIALVTLI